MDRATKIFRKIVLYMTVFLVCAVIYDTIVPAEYRVATILHRLAATVVPVYEAIGRALAWLSSKLRINALFVSLVDIVWPLLQIFVPFGSILNGYLAYARDVIGNVGLVVIGTALLSCIAVVVVGIVKKRFLKEKED